MITSAGYEIDDIGGSLTWGAFGAFIKKLSPDTATYREVHPEIEDWGTRLRTNIILADVYDMLNQINANICAGFSRKKPKKVTPYKRPWVKPGKKLGGKGAMPKNKLHEWMEKKRKEYRHG